MNRRAPAPRRPAPGFTLIEILLAVSLLSLILLLLFSALFSTNRSWAATERRIAQNDELRLVAEFIQRQLAEQSPLFWADQDDTDLLFSGASDELHFTAGLPAHRGGGGAEALTLKVSRAGGERQLALYFQPVSAAQRPFAHQHGGERVVLLANTARIELAYYGREEIEGQSTWRAEWRHTELLPELIGLTVYPATGRPWPQMIIPLHARPAKGRAHNVLAGAAAE